MGYPFVISPEERKDDDNNIFKKGKRRKEKYLTRDFELKYL